MSTSSLKQQAIRAGIWTFVNHFVGNIIRLLSNLILTRLLVPEYFGLMALVNTFLAGLNMFSDIGIGPSLIQNKRGDDPDFFNTAWTLQVVRGFGLWLLSLIIAWPVATFYNEEKLLLLIPIVGFNAVISGFKSTAEISLTRHLEIGKSTRYGLVSEMITPAIIVGWAWFSPTIWAIAGGTIVAGLINLVRSHLLVREISNRFIWEKAAAKELFSFGKWIFISTATAFLAIQADRLMLGKLLPLEILGIYTIAFTFASLPKLVFSSIAGKVVFPIISRFKDVPRQELEAKVMHKRRLLVMGIALVMIILVCFGDLLILALYDQRYKDAAWMLPILSLGFWPLILGSFNNSFLLAFGKPIYGSIANVVKLIFMVIALPLGFSLMGVLGAVIAIALNDIPGYLAFSSGLWREKMRKTVFQDLQITIIMLGLIAILVSVRYLLGFGLPINGIL